MQTISVSDFHRAVFKATAQDGHVDPDPVIAKQLALLCHEVIALLSNSSKTLVVHSGGRQMTVNAPNSPIYLEPLTGRERQVLAMACDGMSAREIGAQLFISERTVETHVSHGYRKLGINSRIELVRRAAEFGF